LPGGTAYITDVGMTGPSEGVIGMDKTVAINRFRHQTPHYYKIAQGSVRVSGVFLEIDENEYKAKSITRLNFSKAEYNGRKTD
jgi:calcineurin-like phosphoesterase